MKIITMMLLMVFAAGAQAFRCGTSLVLEGDHLVEVLNKCGEPDYEQRWVEDRIILRQPHPLLPYERVLGTVVVTIWIYNRGGREFIRELRFENGRLAEIDTLGYGF